MKTTPQGLLTRALAALLLATACLGAQADLKAGEKKVQLCMLCHKPANVGAPLLEGQPEKYLVEAINAYKSGQREDVMQMRANVRNLSARDVADIAAWLASRPPVAGAFTTDAQKAEAGQKLVQDRNCASCHGAAFAGGSLVPRLAGQSPVYLIGQFEAFTTGRRVHPGGGIPAGARADFEAVAHYLASVK
jgi:cytochrome c553